MSIYYSVEREESKSVSFDSDFGTFDGADGIPAQNGAFTVCVNDPATGKCVYPFHDPANRNLLADLNFTQAPRPPFTLPVYPKPG